MIFSGNYWMIDRPGRRFGSYGIGNATQTAGPGERGLTVKNQNHEPDRYDNQPVSDSGNSAIIELEGNEDITVRPLRPCLARMIKREHAEERPESSPTDQTTDR